MTVGAVMLATVVVPDRSRPMQERLYGIFGVSDDAAQRLIEKRGFTRLTTREIAQEAGCAEGTNL